MRVEILFEDQSMIHPFVALIDEFIEKFFPVRVKVVMPKIILPGIDFYFYFQS